MVRNSETKKFNPNQCPGCKSFTEKERICLPHKCKGKSMRGVTSVICEGYER